MFGLSGRQLKLVMQIILKHAAQFEQVILFGSRSRGDDLPFSDIDLAVSYKKNTVFQNDLEESRLPFTVDVVDLSLEKETKLSTFIQKDGVVLFDSKKQGGGEHWLMIATLNEKLSDFKAALAKLHEALSKDIESDDLYLDAIIQRFEFTYELAWKLMKAYLQYLGIEINSPRAAIRESIKQGILKDDAQWFDMIEKRKATAHTYHKEIALSFYIVIKAIFIHLFESFEKAIVTEIKAVRNQD